MPGPAARFLARTLRAGLFLCTQALELLIFVMGAPLVVLAFLLERMEVHGRAVSHALDRGLHPAQDPAVCARCAGPSSFRPRGWERVTWWWSTRVTGTAVPWCDACLWAVYRWRRYGDRQEDAHDEPGA